MFHNFCLEVIPFSKISHTSDAHSTFTDEVLIVWDVKYKIYVIVTDNTRNVIFDVYESNLNHVSCLAHTLQLVVKETIFNHKNGTTCC